MASSYVRASIIQRVKDIITVQGWAAVYLDIENERTKPPQTGDWLAVEFLGSDEQQITTGAPGQNTFREIGDYLIHYVTQSATGADEVFVRLDFIRSKFRATLIDNIKIDGVSPPDSEPGGSLSGVRGNWWGASISTSYEYDIKG